MDSSKQIAGGLTFLVCGAIIICLMLAKLTWDPARPWPPEPDPYIEMTFDDEFVDVIELPRPRLENGNEIAAAAMTPDDLDNDARLAPETGTALENAGEVAPSTAKVVTTERKAAVNTTKKTQPEKAGPAVDTRKQREQAIARQTKNNLASAFAASDKNKNNANQGKADDGNTGRKNGNEASAGPSDPTGKKAGSATGNVGGGWSMPAYSRSIQSNEVGTARFEVEVRADGSVGKVVHTGGSGMSERTISNCIAEIRRHRFTYKGNKPAEAATAYVTFTFTDPK